MHKLKNLLKSIKPEDEGVDKGPDGLVRGKTVERSELEILVQRKHDEVHRKALHHWQLLRESVCSVKKALEEADQKELVLTHGIHRERKLNHNSHVTQVLYIPERKEYLTCDGHSFRFFQEDGRKLNMVEAEDGIDKLIYSNQTNQFVGWKHGQEFLYLMSNNFVIVSQSTAIGKILLATYNHNTGELVTVGPNFITCWAFRYGARHLIPRKTTKTSFGEKKMFAMMVLEETASRSQRMFFAQGSGVVVYNVFSGLEIAHKKELHAQPVTALTFFNPLKYVITGAKDGCIKIWDNDWKVQMVFVGHSDQVNFLRIYPYGPAFISSSLDCTVRVWNMETCDEVDKTVISEPIEGMGTHMNYDIFFTHSGKHVDLWRLQHFYQIHTNIGYRVSNIKITSHPSYPQRAVLMCRDSSIRIVSPLNGEVITTLLMNKSDGVVDAAYAIAEEMCNYLLVYEYVVDPMETGNIWEMMRRTVQTRAVQVAGGENGLSSTNNRTLLLGGRKDGYICVFDWKTGEVTFKVEAHGSKGVLNMIANSKSDQLISAGMDNIIKIWRLYPFAEEALAPLMSFYCAHTPSFMTTIKTSLGVAFQDPSTATFSVVLYSLPDKSDRQHPHGYRKDHQPDDDHMDIITGLTSCPRMKLYASCGMDGTIRIWSEDNDLIRLIKINTIPNSLAFCSPQGDLLVGIGNHLFFISYKKYLPLSYIRRQACMKFTTPAKEEPLPYQDNILLHMNKNDVKRLKNSHASFKFTHFVDILSAEEEEEVMKEIKLRQEAFAFLESRELELQMIRDGGLKSREKPMKGKKKTQMRAFKEYMKMYYDKPRLQLPPDDYPAGEVDNESEGEEEEKYKPELSPYGFFSEVSQKTFSDVHDPQHPLYPSTPSGYLPNSVLLKILYPPPMPQLDPKEVKPYTPPQLNAEQLQEIQGLYHKKTGRRESELELSRNVTFAQDEHLSRVLEIDLSDDNAEPDPSSEPIPDGTAMVFEEAMKERVLDSADAPTSGAATMATFDRSSAMTIRTFSDLPDSRPLTTPKTPQKSRLSRKKKSSLLESDEEDEEIPGLSVKSSSLLSKFQEIMDKPASDTPLEEESNEVHDDDEANRIREKKAHNRQKNLLNKTQMMKKLRFEDKATMAVEEIEEEREPVPPPAPAKRQVQMPTKPVTKLISRPKPVAKTPTPPPSPTPPPPPTPLPNFIKQFIGTDWFDKYFPNCSENTMPKPWTSDTFVNMIVKLLRIAEWRFKVSVSDAILFVHTEEGVSDTILRTVVKTLLAVLNHHTTPPNCTVVDEKDFIMAALKALTAFAFSDKEVIAEMMVQFLDGDRDIRSNVVEVMTHLGLTDPHRQFQKELDSWDVWGIDEKNHKDELHKMSNQWLDRWLASYKMRIKDTVEELNKGHSLHGRLSHRGSILPASRRSSLMPPDNETLTTIPGSGEGGLVPGSHRGGRLSAMSHSTTVTVTLDRAQGSSIMESVGYIDALNYFCEMMMEKELDALRRGELLRRQAGETVVQAKNTVLVLPKIAKRPALVRLGEMHTSQTRPQKRDYFLPPIRSRGYHSGDIFSFVPCINFPMKQVYLNPFPSALDERDAMLSHPLLITLKSSQKLFVPSQSYVPVEEDTTTVA